MQDLPRLPRGWEWRHGRSGPFAHKNGSSVTVSSGYLYLSDTEPSDEFVVGTDIIVAVLKANGVTL